MKTAGGHRNLRLTGFAWLAALALVLAACAGEEATPTTAGEPEGAQEPEPAQEPDDEEPDDGEPGDDEETQEAASDDYPNQPIHMIVPWSPGGNTDNTGRLVASVAGNFLDVPIRYRALPGGGGTDGSVYVIESEADGHTLSFGSTGSVLTGPLFDDVGYSWDDFVPVVLMTEVPIAFAVAPDSQFETFDDLIEYSRENPGDITYGTSGVGSSVHLTAELVAQQLDVEWTHVPFDGASEAVVAVAGGHVDMAVPGVGVAGLGEGLVRGLVHTGAERISAVPDIPTLEEEGIEPPAFAAAWIGVFAPAGTPEPRIAYLEEVFRSVHEDEEYQGILESQGGVPRFLSSAEAQELINNQAEELSRVIAELDG